MPRLHPCESVFDLNDADVSLESFLNEVTAETCSLGLLSPLLEIDHVCFRIETLGEYRTIVARMKEYGTIIADSMINGRPITTVKLQEPIVYSNWKISCIELPCPKTGSHYPRGWEHIEVVIGDTENGCLNNKTLLETFILSHTTIEFDRRAIDKDVNADVSMTTSNKIFSVKFHVRPLYEVCAFESLHGFTVPVPEDYFTTL